MTPDKLFAGHPLSFLLYQQIQQTIQDIGEAQEKTTKSQVAFYHRRAFAWVWRPGQYLDGRGAPRVLTVSLRSRDPSPRWKEVVEPHPGRFVHHLELTDPADVDDEVINWLRRAWAEGA